MLVLGILFFLLFIFVTSAILSAKLKFLRNSTNNKKNNLEEKDWDVPDPKYISARFKIEHIDGAGKVSSRIVNVREFDTNLYGGAFTGICELRDAYRTFRFDRVKSCIDMDTGEIIKNIKIHLKKLYDTSPDRSIDMLLSNYIDVLKVIYFVAKADGQYRKAEKEVIRNYVRLLVHDERIENEMIDWALQNIEIPTRKAFELAITRLCKSTEIDLNKLTICCKEIVATQKTIHSLEQEALEFIENSFTEIKKYAA